MNLRSVVVNALDKLSLEGYAIGRESVDEDVLALLKERGHDIDEIIKEAEAEKESDLW